MQLKFVLVAVLLALLALAACVEARSVAQIKASVVASQAKAKGPKDLRAPTGTSVADLAKYSKKKIIEVIATGVQPQQKGDREQNEEFIKATKFDLRWAKSIKEKHLTEGNALLPKTDNVNAKFIDFQAKNTRLPLIEPKLFND